jgi:F-type H+-transporting ATPase subunit gamma
METLEILGRKIKTAHDLLGVVKTMKSLAAVNIRQYETAARVLDHYKDVVEWGWTVLLRNTGRMGHSAAGRNGVCLVIGSDQGMCGQFNETVVQHALKARERLAAKGLKVEFWATGERAASALEEVGFPQSATFGLPGSVAGINTAVQSMVLELEAAGTTKGMVHFYVCHNMLSGTGSYTQALNRVLPLDESWAGQLASRPWPGRCIPMLPIPAQEMFRHLFRQHLFISFYHALAQSLASENAARLMAMQAAEKNILEMEEDLQARFREQRQANITNELLDITSGFEALSQGPD